MLVHGPSQGAECEGVDISCMTFSASPRILIVLSSTLSPDRRVATYSPRLRCAAIARPAGGLLSTMPPTSRSSGVLREILVERQPRRMACQREEQVEEHERHMLLPAAPQIRPSAAGIWEFCAWVRTWKGFGSDGVGGS